MTGLTGAVNLSQWRLNLVVAELHTTLLLIRHVAVCTRYTTLCVDAMLRHLPTRMLSLQNLGFRQWMDIVVETYLVVVFLSSLAGQPLVVWEYQVVSLARVLLIVRLDEVVLHVALGAHQRTHLLMGGILHVQTTTGKGLVERRTGRAQIHRACIVTVATTNGVHLLSAQLTPFLGVEVGRIEDRIRTTEFAHHARHIRTLTRPTRSRLHIGGDGVRRNLNAWIASTQNLTHILQRVLVSARGVVVARESVASPQHYHLRTLFEHIHLLRRVVLRLKRGVLSHCPRLVLTRIVGLELLILCHDGVLKHGALVVKHTRHLSPALHQRRNEQSQNKDHNH